MKFQDAVFDSILNGSVILRNKDKGGTFLGVYASKRRNKWELIEFNSQLVPHERNVVMLSLEDILANDWTILGELKTVA